MESDIIKRIAVDTAVDKDVVKKVINHSLGKLVKASRECSSMEMTGWGTFYFKEKKVKYYVKRWEKKIEERKKHLKSLNSEHAIKRLEKRICNEEESLRKLKKRYGLEENL